MDTENGSTRKQTEIRDENLKFSITTIKLILEIANALEAIA
jgi:hypothetical protein